MRRLAKLSVVPVVAVLALSGCGANNDKHSAAGSPAASTTAASSTKSIIGTGGLTNPAGAIKSLQGVTCAPDSHGDWSASGTIQNAAATQGEFLVEFAVVKQQDSEVVGSASKTVKIAAGKSADISLPKLYSGNQKGLICVPRVLRGSAS